VIRNGQSSGTFIGQTLHLGHGLRQVGRPSGRDAIRAAAVIGLQWLDEASLFQPRDSAVESPRTQNDTSKSLDVLRKSMSVLRSAGQAGENQNGRIIGSSFSVVVSFPCHSVMVLRDT
jgi:hypothetical protein